MSQLPFFLVTDLNGGLDVVIFIYMLSFIWDGIEAMFQYGIRYPQ